MEPEETGKSGQLKAQSQPSEMSKFAFEFFSQKAISIDVPEFAQCLIYSLIEVIKQSQETTFAGLNRQIVYSGEYIIEQAKKQNLLKNRTDLFLKSAQNLFQQFIKKTLQKSQSGETVEQLKINLINAGIQIINITKNAKEKIQKHTIQFLQNGIQILVYGYSTTVEDALLYGVEKGKKFSVIICETRPLNEGLIMYSKLSKKIPCKYIIDSAIGCCLEEVDMILVGSEAVAENGGIINRIGTYTIALCAKALKKPFYVLSESLKFSRLYPSCQKDIPEEYQNYTKCNIIQEDQLKDLDLKIQDIVYKNPICDYTPPNLITLLFTDVGIYTPSAVSDELLQMFSD